MASNGFENITYGSSYLSTLYSALNKNILSTLKIEAHDSLERNQNSLREVFQAPFNPSGLTIEYRNEWQKPQGLGTSGAKLTFSANLPERIKFKLIFADSEVLRYGYDWVPGANLKSKTSPGFIKDRLNGFKGANSSSILDSKKVSDYPVGVDNQVHKFIALTTQKIASDNDTPPYLILRWGHILSRAKVNEEKLEHQYHYPCQLESVDVHYTLFSRHGFPLRAELDCVFIEDYSEASKDNPASHQSHANPDGSASTNPLLSNN